MLERYSHIRTEAKRAALDAIVQKANHSVFGEVVHQNVHQVEPGVLDASRKSLGFLVDVRGFEPLTPCLQRGRSKILNGFVGVAYTENQRSSRSSNVPKLYRIQ